MFLVLLDTHCGGGDKKHRPPFTVIPSLLGPNAKHHGSVPVQSVVVLWPLREEELTSH